MRLGSDGYTAHFSDLKTARTSYSLSSRIQIRDTIYFNFLYIVAGPNNDNNINKIIRDHLATTGNVYTANRHFTDYQQ